MIAPTRELGLTYEQKVIYDWKPPHCLSCGVFGHVGCGGNGKGEVISGKSLEEDPAITLNKEVLQQNIGSESSLMENGSARSCCEPSKVGEDDEGWETVRVRKKKSDGFGAPKPGPFRPISQGVKGGSYGVSTAHWRNRNLTHGQVRQTASLPKIVDVLNLKTCPDTVPGPPPCSDKPILDGVLSNPPTEPDNLAKPSDYPKSGPTDISEPKEPPNLLESLNQAPTSSETSAGHTPYHNRLATLARDLRRRQSGMAGLKTNDGFGPKSSGEPQGDKHPSLSFSLLDTLNHESPLRPGKGQIAYQGESGISGNNLTRIEDRLGNLREENAMKNKDLQKERDTHSRKTLNLNFPDLHGGRNVLKDVARKEAHANKIGRDNGEVGQHTELGHGLAETQ